MKNAPTIEYLRESFDYNAETGELRWRTRPRSHFKNSGAWKLFGLRFAGHIAGSQKDGYWHVKLDARMYLAHRIAFALSFGRWPREDIDHISGDQSDNRFINLRETSRTGNCQNQKLRRTNKSGALGVNWNKQRRKWQVSICVDYYRKQLGMYEDLPRAIAVRKSAEIEFGFHPNHGRST